MLIGMRSLLTILAIGAFFVVLILVVVSFLRSYSNSPRPRSAVVLGEASHVIDDLSLALAGGRNSSFARTAPNSLTITDSVTPGWAVVVAVLVFPIGLLALVFANDHYTATIVADDEPGGRCTLRFGGSFSKRSVNRINTVIDHRSRSAQAA